MRHKGLTLFSLTQKCSPKDERTRFAEEKEGQLYRHTCSRCPIKILIALSVFFMLNIYFWFRLVTTSPIPNDQIIVKMELSDAAQLDPVVIEYGQKDLVPALQQSIMVHHNVLCADLAELQKKKREALPSPPDFPVRISFRMNCQELFQSNIYGTGNVLLMFYNIRLVARLLGNVHVDMQCTDAVAKRSSLVIPWLMGSFPSSSPYDKLQAPSLKDACDKFQPETAHVIVDDIKYELRRMAISMVGVPHENHPATKFIVDASREKNLQVPMAAEPLHPDVELDDVAIHFRCGDIIELRPHPKYRYARWPSLVKLISPEARSIGIVTQPFQGQTRSVDRTNKGRCPQLVEPFQAYLQAQFPRAKVSIRNSPNETIAIAFTRLIMANQSLSGGFSTFYIMPFHAAFGTTYEINEDDMIPSKEMMELWSHENGVQQILSLFTGS